MVGHEDRDSAFTDGLQWTLRDPDGQQPPQAVWPTEWRETAVLYARAVDARRKAVDEPYPPWAPPPQSLGLVQPDRPATIQPDRWDGLPHERPGLHRRIHTEESS